MAGHCAHIKPLVALMLTTVALFLRFAGSAFGQSATSRLDNKSKDVATAEPKPKDLQSVTP